MWRVVSQQSPQKSDLCDDPPPSALLNYLFLQALSGTELATPNRESGDSESGDSNRRSSIPRSQSNIDRPRFGLAILSRFSAILLCCGSTHFCALTAEIVAIEGPRFRELCDQRSKDGIKTGGIKETKGRKRKDEKQQRDGEWEKKQRQREGDKKKGKGVLMGWSVEAFWVA